MVTIESHPEPRLRPETPPEPEPPPESTDHDVQAIGNSMWAGESLAPDTSLRSSSGRYRLTYQSDNNLVLYRAADNAALWATSPQTGWARRVRMQGDGNLVVYTLAHEAVWASGTDGHAGAHLTLQNDGNLVIHRAGDGAPVWATNTVEGTFRLPLHEVAGWVVLELRPDSTVHFFGHAHNDGLIAEAVDFTVRMVVGSGDVVAVLQHSGHLAGTGGSAEARNDYWDETTSHPEVLRHWDELIIASAHVFEFRRGAVLGVVTNMLEFLRSNILGAILLDPGTGVVIFLGTELASLVATGSLVPGAIILSGVLYMTGPTGSLYAIPAEGIASIGERQRIISQPEYEHANHWVYNGTLPPRDTIIITDTVGANDRAFTFPGPEFIRVNIGTNSFSNPLNVAPDIFIHELAHVWQIHHSSDKEWIAAALATQAGDPTYEAVITDPPQPFSSFNLEQQAQIVQDWYRSSRALGQDDVDSALYHYIVTNIRVGQLWP